MEPIYSEIHQIFPREKEVHFWTVILSVSEDQSDRYDVSIKLLVTFSLLNSFSLWFFLTHEWDLVPRSPPWRFEFSSMEILIPSGDLVLPSMLSPLPFSPSVFLSG
jgi:hypothetical protein